MRVAFILFISLIGLSSCFEEPELSDTPKISFNDVLFYDANATDSLVIVINFEDGDGDMGLSPSQTFPPFHQYSFFTNENGLLITLNEKENISVLVNQQSTTLTTQELSNAINPSIKINYGSQDPPSYSIFDYVINPRLEDLTLQDTFFVEPNIYYNNFVVRYYTKNQSGEFVEFDWRQFSGLTFNGRFPVINDDDDEKTLQGSIRYRMQSPGLYNLFFDDTLQLQVEIYDRSLNISNTMTTPEFTLDEILQ